jgi:hypothetical protein
VSWWSAQQDVDMVPNDAKDFFLASAGVAGALIGLLFVAISVSQGHLTGVGTSQLQRLRGAAAMSAFSNALVVSLFALVPGRKVGWSTLTASILGLLFVVASLIVLVRAGTKRWHDAWDVVFLLSLATTFVAQLLSGLQVLAHPDDAGTVDTIAVLVIVCFFIGIARAWELIGGPQIGLAHEVAALVKKARDPTGADAANAQDSTGAPARVTD